MFLGFVVLMFGLLTAEVVNDYQPKKLSALFFAISWFPLIALHEAGHALVAAWYGHRVLEVVIGFGRPLWTLSIRGVDVQVRALPIEGFVRHSGPASGYKSALISFAGPGAELLLAVILLLVVGPEAMLSPSEKPWLIACQSVSIAAVMSAVVNLIPHEIRNSPGDEITIPNDGMAIVRSLFGR